MTGSVGIRAYRKQTLKKRLEENNISPCAFSTRKALLENFGNKWGIHEGTWRAVVAKGYY